MNFILFFPDEMRAESLSCYGHPIVKTPNYDRLACEGVRFEQCHIQHPVCTPSRCCLMTGWYPHVMGHRTLWHSLRAHEPSLFKYLKEAGYHIEWYGKNDLYERLYFPQAVDKWGFSGSFKKALIKGNEELSNSTFLYEPPDDSIDTTTEMQNVRSVINFLRNYKDGDKPFFIYLPLNMPHPPYAAPKPYHDMYDPDELPPLRPADLEDKPDFHTLLRKTRGLDKIHDSVFKKVQAVYLGEISFVDYVLGELLKVLNETGLTTDTTLIASSDHGDWAGDYGLVEKWPSGLEDVLTRVPLIIRSPENKKGHVVKEQVEMFDIMATVLELAGVEPQHTHFSKSLTNQIKGQPGDPERAVFAEGGYATHEPHCFEGYYKRPDSPLTSKFYADKHIVQQEYPLSVCRTTMIRTLDYKLIKRPEGQSELYNLKDDPMELLNIYGKVKYQTAQISLEERLLNWYIQTSDVVPWDDDERALPPFHE